MSGKKRRWPAETNLAALKTLAHTLLWFDIQPTKLGRDGEVYCHSEDLANIARNRDLNTVLEAVNDLYPQTEHSNAPEQEPMGGMTLG
ncbi:hypothetical protein LIR37_11270 [Flavonifractor plautii]|uniref:hypothetical protein n=1 Tax=Flavonifractor plautii TaxID=292800 RepID=UPI001D02E866|nr:hypothetical protein [Flavonifractor plautii]MCB5854947.1 hypothetical protein [Flavonifractor plautii]